MGDRHEFYAVSLFSRQLFGNIFASVDLLSLGQSGLLGWSMDDFARIRTSGRDRHGNLQDHIHGSLIEASFGTPLLGEGSAKAEALEKPCARSDIINRRIPST